MYEYIESCLIILVHINLSETIMSISVLIRIFKRSLHFRTPDRVAQSQGKHQPTPVSRMAVYFTRYSRGSFGDFSRTKKNLPHWANRRSATIQDQFISVLTSRTFWTFRLWYGWETWLFKTRFSFTVFIFVRISLPNILNFPAEVTFEKNKNLSFGVHKF